MTQTMSEYFVAGGIFENPMGTERFDLVCAGPGEPPLVMAESVMHYFRLVWQNAHLYRVEKDYTLVLIVSSPEALERGVKAPPRVTPDQELLAKLQSVIKHEPSSPTPTSSQ